MSNLSHTVKSPKSTIIFDIDEQKKIKQAKNKNKSTLKSRPTKNVNFAPITVDDVDNDKSANPTTRSHKKVDFSDI